MGKPERSNKDTQNVSNEDSDREVYEKHAGRNRDFVRMDHRKIIYEIGKFSQDGEAEREKSLDANREKIAKVDMKGQTLLHRIMDQPNGDDEPEGDGDSLVVRNEKHLVDWFLDEYKDLLSKQDNKPGWTALHLATKDRGDLLKHIVQRKKGRRGIPQDETSPDGLTEALNVLCESKTCLDLALIEPDCVEALEELVIYTSAEYLDQRGQNGNTPLHLAIAHGKPSAKVVKSLVSKSPNAVRIQNDKGHTPYQSLISILSATESKQEQEYHKEREDIKEILKHQILLQMPFRDAIKYLYTDTLQEEHLITLNFCGHTDPINKSLLSSLRHIKVESILQYVALPKLGVGRDVLSRSSQAVANSHKPVFDWLRENKVTKILHLKVEEDRYNPHSDDDIKSRVESLVEFWDWEKVDICATVIKKAAPGMKELSLYSSGNNSVLKSWSGCPCKDVCSYKDNNNDDDDCTGLASLKDLRKINLTIYSKLEEETRVKKYFQSFKRRIESRMKDIMVEGPEIHLPHRKGEDSYRKAPHRHAIEDHQWSKHMGNYASYTLPMVPKDPERDIESVKVALIDNGIHLPQDDLIIMGSKSFWERDKTSFRDFFVAPGGHGTQMVTLIRKMCPQVHFYIARVEDLRQASGERGFTTQSVIELRAQNFEILSQLTLVGYPLGRRERRGHYFHELVSSPARRREQPKRVDGSQGSTQSIMKGLPGVISIGAATAFGKQAKFVPDGANFILPGHQVSLLDPASGTSTIESGSSISTALAAGLAALILRCEEIVRTQSQLPSPSESLNRMNLRKYIKYIFHRLSDKDTGYVQVTKTFLMYENDSQANQIDKVRQMLERIYHTS
ncbi:MAG: hypothetical protein MMC33_003811 [Icmadophila ericetorum]|nr:hypothetical protein [Icmadophila ericetorum]